TAPASSDLGPGRHAADHPQTSSSSCEAETDAHPGLARPAHTTRRDLDQPHSLKLELARKLPSLHDPPPVPSKHLTRCLRNRVQASTPYLRCEAPPGTRCPTLRVSP